MNMCEFKLFPFQTFEKCELSKLRENVEKHTTILTKQKYTFLNHVIIIIIYELVQNYANDI